MDCPSAVELVRFQGDLVWVNWSVLRIHFLSIRVFWQNSNLVRSCNLEIRSPVTLPYIAFPNSDTHKSNSLLHEPSAIARCKSVDTSRFMGLEKDFAASSMLVVDLQTDAVLGFLKGGLQDSESIIVTGVRSAALTASYLSSSSPTQGRFAVVEKSSLGVLLIVSGRIWYLYNRSTY